ncbi:hypothetical protein NJ76_25930 [Rhodococcus sp. IITR03]|nr:hypothetical protein NJ76_25930 [Rhodococcus sp. IITR03]
MEELNRWFSSESAGVGIVTGYGGVELLEFETIVVFTDWCRLMVEAGHADELRALCGGYLAASGGGGYHLIYRTANLRRIKFLREWTRATMCSGTSILQR